LVEIDTGRDLGSYGPTVRLRSTPALADVVALR